MQAGIQFFSAIEGEQSESEYFADCLDLVELVDRLGFDHVRTVEHYFRPYGGLTPNPIVFLAAAAQRSKQIRLITGAVLPVFNHPLKLAGEIGMLDAISGGRAEIGFARAFLPHEFLRFGRSMDESRARFDEGLDAVTQLLESEGVAFAGKFHQCPYTTSLPRPTQRSRPPFWIAAASARETFINAGTLGHGIMVIPGGTEALVANIAEYREAFRSAGHEGNPRVMVAVHMVCNTDAKVARATAEEAIEKYLSRMVAASSEWQDTLSKDYPGYDKMITAMADETFESQLESGGAWVGTPDEVYEQARSFNELAGPFDTASMQVNPGGLDVNIAKTSVELFAAHVLPRLQ